jgi:serine/threonine-protein kinase
MPEYDKTQLRRTASPAPENTGAAPHGGDGFSHAYPEMLLRRYRVMNSCGTGGFGAVLACWDTRLQRRVAIKRLPLISQAGVASTESQAMASTIDEALGEARTASRLEHPNIVAIHDFEVEDGIAYIVMEYVDGLTLADLLARVEGGTLTHDETAYLVHELGCALAFAHQNGILHLDIKPSNIMFTYDGSVKLCDFGMATLASAAGYADARGGTIGYMPPEQLEGKLVDERTDVFALAVVTLEALLGTRLFVAPTAEASLALIQRGPKPKLSKMDASLDGLTEQLLLSCLSPDATDRPYDIGLVANDIAYDLGDPEAGAQSLSALLSQTHEPGGPSDQDSLKDRLPLTYRYPWLWPLIIRGATSMVCALLVWRLAPYETGFLGHSRVLTTLFAACAAALWTPLAAVVVVVMLVAALHGTGSSPFTVMVSGVALILTFICLTKGHGKKAVSLALLVAPALGEPAASAAIAGTSSSIPLAALASATSWGLARVMSAATSTGFSVSQLEHVLVLSLRPSSLMSFLGCIVAACVASVITRSGSSSIRSIVGQILGCVVVIFFQLLAVRMENGGIWPTPNWSTVGVAVLLGVLVCLALALRGPREFDWEDGETA